MILFDTHLLIWAVQDSPRLPTSAYRALEMGAGMVFFSVVSVWAIAVKNAGPRPRMNIDAKTLRGVLLQNGFIEIPIKAEHAVATQTLPPIHRDPFDRTLIAQAKVEGPTLLTADETMARYGAPARLA